MVADTLLKHVDSPLGRRLASRRSRPSLRSSLFVSQDEPDNEGAAEAEAYIAAARLRLAPPNADSDTSGDSSSGKMGFRGRARSLSNTLSNFLSGRRKRRHSSPNTDGGDGGDGEASGQHEQP